jgi:hypothetical protein
MDLREQGADQGGVTLLGGRQLRGKDLAAGGIDREMEKLWGGGEVTHHRRRPQPDGDTPCYGQTT